MPWLTTFWSENSDGIITGLILVVFTAVFTRLTTPNPDRRRWRHRNRLERLRARLEQHERRLENPAQEIAGIIRYVFRQVALLIGLLVIAMSLFLIGGKIENFILWPTLFALLNNALVFWDASRDISRIAEPEKRREALGKQIKKLEERGF